MPDENSMSSAATAYGRPNTKAARTRQVVHELLLQHDREDGVPTSLRFVFYELEQRGDATKPDPDDRRPNKRRNRGWPPGAQDVTDAVTWLREQAVVPWGWIEDEQRSVTDWRYDDDSVADFVLAAVNRARINPWDFEPPLILTESLATAGVLRHAVASHYLCPIAGTKGQAHGFLVTEVAPLLVENDRPVLYLGDLDRPGEDIEGTLAAF